MQRPGLFAVLAAASALTAGTPASANIGVVGYLPPGVDYGIGDDAEAAFGEVRAQGVVVNDLEPGARGPDTGQTCSTEGCLYELVVVDPAAVRAQTDPHSDTVGCASDRYGVIDAAPEQAPLGSGARLYTGHGPLPTHITATQNAATTAPLSPGIGLLCFATAASDSQRTDARGPLAATQPDPVVIFYSPDAPFVD